MGRTACTEPQCLYKGDLYLYLFTYFFHTNLSFQSNKKSQLHFSKFAVTNHVGLKTWAYIVIKKIVYIYIFKFV
jgi:hypothetical protein